MLSRWATPYPALLVIPLVVQVTSTVTCGAECGAYSSTNGTTSAQPLVHGPDAVSLYFRLHAVWTLVMNRLCQSRLAASLGQAPRKLKFSRIWTFISQLR